MHMVAGTLRPDGGQIAVRGNAETDYSVARALNSSAYAACSRNCRCARTSASPRTRASTIRRSPASAGGARRPPSSPPSWTRSFPDHGISADDIAGDLSIGRRQMVEVARAFTVTRDPLDLVILDEPTSSLDAHTAGQLLAFVRRFVAAGGSCILISHVLGEVLQNADRIVVMRDGKVVATDAAKAFDRDRLVATMGGAEAREKIAAEIAARPAAGAAQGAGAARAAAGRQGARRPCRRDHRPCRACRPWPDRPAAGDLRRRGARQGRHRGDRAGGAGGRRPPVGRHLSAMVDRGKHRHPLAGAAAQRAADLAAARGGACRILEAEDRHPHARHEQQHFFAVGRQPAEGAVCPRARLGCRRSC